MAKKETTTQASKKKKNKSKCGIIMPISAIGECSVKHWEDVKRILCESVSKAGYTADIVSNSDESGVIQKTIVQNLYENEIVICDVSCKNPNVMFELGMRLAFDKPTIIVMDDKTDYTFDIGIIEHIEYPRDLNYYSIKDFQERLTDRIVGTIEAAKEPTYTTFLKHFGNFTPAKISDKEAPAAFIPYFEEITRRLDSMSSQMSVKSQIQSVYATDNINAIIKRKLQLYMNRTNISISELYLNKNNEQSGLLEYLKENLILRRLCRNRSQILIDEMKKVIEQEYHF